MDVNDLLILPEFADADADQLERKLKAAEELVFAYTHNSFRDAATGAVCFPAPVQEGIIKLLSWDIQFGGKTGIQSETIGRHSVTYTGTDSADRVFGYPASLLGFLKPYKKARF